MLFTKYYYDYQIYENELGGAYSRLQGWCEMHAEFWLKV
jgi:hypothetical protein